jgi:hypothetical protein
MKWRTPPVDRAFDQGAALHRVVAIIFERFSTDSGTTTEPAKMHDRADACSPIVLASSG